MSADCADCGGRAPADCPGCDGSGVARPTLPAPPPPADDPTASTTPTLDGWGEAWPEEVPTGVQCPDARRKQIDGAR